MGKDPQQNFLGKTFIPPEFIKELEEGIKELAGDKNKRPELGLDLQAIKGEQGRILSLYEIFVRESNRLFFDRGTSSALDEKGDGKVTESEMTKAITELNNGGQKIHSEQDLREMTKGLQVSDEVIKKGVEFQKSIDRADGNRNGDTINIEVPKGIPSTSQPKTPHL